MPLVFAGAADLIAEHKRRGHDVVIVSASAEDIVEPIASTLGATHAMATRLAVEEGRYTGDVAFHCYGERKVHAIHDLASREGYPLEHCYAYSDSISDLPMLEAVGYPSVVNPDRSLRREAGLKRGREITARCPASSLSGTPRGRCATEPGSSYQVRCRCIRRGRTTGAAA